MVRAAAAVLVTVSELTSGTTVIFQATVWLWLQDTILVNMYVYPNNDMDFQLLDFAEHSRSCFDLKIPCFLRTKIFI